MDRPSSPSRSQKSRNRHSTILYSPREPDDTFGNAAGNTIRFPGAQSPMHTSPRLFLGNEGVLPGLSYAGQESIPSSPELTRRKRMSRQMAPAPQMTGSDEEQVVTAQPPAKPARPQTIEMSNGTSLDTYTQWRIGRGRRRSSGHESARPKSTANFSKPESRHSPQASLQDSPRSLRVQTQPTTSRPVAPPQRSDEHSRTLAQLTGSGASAPARAIDARKLLLLMNTTKGRCHGKVAVQKDPTSPWMHALCVIDTRMGGLKWTPISASSRGDAILIHNLRGCRVQALLKGREGKAEILLRGLNAEQIRLRPETHAQFEAWFAAFLCWQSAQGNENPEGQGGVRRLAALPFPAGPLRKANDKPSGRPARSKDATSAIIKVGKLLYLDPDITDRDHVTPIVRTNSGVSSSPSRDDVLPPWRKVSCIIRESGEMLLYTTRSLSELATIRLSQLTRSAVQRLHTSLFAMDYCIALYPQYSDTTDVCSRVRPIFLSFETRVLFESWFVLLRAFTLPEIYGSRELSDTVKAASPTTPFEDLNMTSLDFLPGLRSPEETKPGLFRVERTLHVQVGEARLRNPDSEAEHTHASERSRSHGRNGTGQQLYYVRIFLDGQSKAKTTAKADKMKPFWYESFELIDIGPASSSVAFQVKTKSPENISPTEQYSNYSQHLQRRRAQQAYLTDDRDPTLGEVIIDFNEFEPHKEVDKYWPLLDRDGQSVGDLSLKIRVGEEIILMDADYHSLDVLLGNFTNSLTFQIAEKIPAELTRLSEVLLNIYQASNKAEEWLCSLAEEEIDGIRKEAPPGRLRIDSGDSRDSRETMVREENKSALAEANLLFRGNTLLSKALDLHMKRLGKEYLEETIGAKVRAIAEADLDCEVDPVRLGGGSLQQNWDRLNAAVRAIWKSIAESASRCPTELRLVFRHVRACAEDRYGDRMRSVSYTSVSGFLFLRFFCPAVLNPRLFGLLKDNPTPRSQRTFTLLAKSLQGLANQSQSFGAKEPWMGPMNNFLQYFRQQFKDFIDSICSVPSTSAADTQLPASYSAPRAIFTRLPASSKEGFPKTPYLIDHCRNLSALVNLWMDNYPLYAYQTTPMADVDLYTFHKTCTDLRLKAQASLANADRVEKGINAVQERWITIAERMEQNSEEFYLDADPTSAAAQASAMANAYGSPSPNFSHPLTPDAATLSPDSEEAPEEFRRDRPRGKGHMPSYTSAYSSPYLGSAGAVRSATSVLSADTTSTSDKNGTGTPANRSRAPSRAPSSLSVRQGNTAGGGGLSGALSGLGIGRANTGSNPSLSDTVRREERDARINGTPRSIRQEERFTPRQYYDDDTPRKRDQDRERDGTTGRKSRDTRTSRDERERPAEGKKQKERSESRFNIFGRRKKN